MRVSVVLAAYNAADTIEAAIRSVLDQTHRDLELIAVEDGSNDETPSILQRLAAVDDRLVVLENPDNLGLVRSLQRGIEAARGEYVARMDADDICHPRRLELQVAYLDAQPEIDVVGSRYRLFSDDPAEARIDPRHDAFYTADGIRRGRTPFAHPTVCFRREVVERFGTYDAGWAHAEDHELWARWFARGARFAVLDEYLLDYRIHSGSITASKTRLVVARSLKVNLRAIFRHRVRFTREGYGYVMRQLGYLAFGPIVSRWVGRRRDAADHAANAS